MSNENFHITPDSSFRLWCSDCLPHVCGVLIRCWYFGVFVCGCIFWAVGKHSHKQFVSICRLVSPRGFLPSQSPRIIRASKQECLEHTHWHQGFDILWCIFDLCLRYMILCLIGQCLCRAGRLASFSSRIDQTSGADDSGFHLIANVIRSYSVNSKGHAQ